MPVKHLLKTDSYYITICGIDTEYIDGSLAFFDKDKSMVTCKRCIAVMIKDNRKLKEILAG